MQLACVTGKNKIYLCRVISRSGPYMPFINMNSLTFWKSTALNRCCPRGDDFSLGKVVLKIWRPPAAINIKHQAKLVIARTSAPLILTLYSSFLICGRISTTCVMSKWRNVIKHKYMFLFPLKNLECKWLIKYFPIKFGYHENNHSRFLWISEMMAYNASYHPDCYVEQFAIVWW